MNTVYKEFKVPLISFKLNPAKFTEDAGGANEEAVEKKGPTVFTIKGNLSSQVTEMLNEEFDRRKPATETVAVDYFLIDEKLKEDSNKVFTLSTGADLNDIKDIATDMIVDGDNRLSNVSLVLSPAEKIHSLIPSLEAYAKENNFKVYYSLESFVTTVMDMLCPTKH